MVQVGVPDYIQNLKKLRGLRSVGAPLREDEEIEQPEEIIDLSSGTSPNQPLPDPVDGGVAPISYDVRANEVVDPEKDNDQFRQLGRGLAGLISDKNQTAEAGFLPSSILPSRQEAIDWASEPSQGERLINVLRKNYVPTKEQALESAEGPTALTRTYQQISNAFKPKEEIKSESQLGAAIDKGQANPLKPIYGSTNEVANSPQAQAKFREITGRDWSPDIQRFAQEYEDITLSMDEGLAGYDENLTERQNAIKERIENGGATDEDKFLIGVALLMPLLIGGIFGAEAGLSAGSGAATSLANIFSKRKDQMLENEDTLTDLAKQRAEVALKRGQVKESNLTAKQKFIDNLPKDSREHLQGKKEAVWINPETGNEEVGIELKPGLVVRPEFVTSKEELSSMNKEAQDIAVAKGAVDTINKLTDDIINISSKLKDPSLINKAFVSYATGKEATLRSKLSDMVDFEGRKVNAGVILDSKIKALVDAYRQAKGMRALTNTVQDHIEGMLSNPVGSFNSFQDTIDQMIYLKDLAQTNLLNNAESQGFIPEFLQVKYEKSNNKTANELNKANDKKGLKSIKKELSEEDNAK